MKTNARCLILIVLILAFTRTKAQLIPRNMYMGGNLKGQFNKTTNANSGAVENKVIDVQPQIGYAVTNSILVGAELSYRNQINRRDRSDNHVNDKGVGLFFRKYHKISNRCNIWMHASAKYNLATTYYLSFGSLSAYDYKENIFSLSFTPGLSYAVSKRFQLELGLNNLLLAGKKYNTQYISYNNTTRKSTSVDLGFNLPSSSRLTLGCRYSFK